MVFKRIVLGVQVLTLVVAAATLVLLFVRQGPAPAASPEAASPGATIFAQNCATCHGADGTGGTAPALVGKVAAKFPNIDDQIAVITDGRGAMPGFGTRLDHTQIWQVVEWTRRTPNAGGGGGDMKSLYLANCAGCHGDAGEGTYAPAFAGGQMVAKYPAVADQIAVVKQGRPNMAGFAGRLTDDQIASIVEYTRKL